MLGTGQHETGKGEKPTKCELMSRFSLWELGSVSLESPWDPATRTVQLGGCPWGVNSSWLGLCAHWGAHSSGASQVLTQRSSERLAGW